ncbi:MAG: dNTP triphosphohydrolase [Calditrichaeota bacterium]|nr:MAG: dNTP triphosphohydrolase [Calditrichota bacterium]
MNRFYNEFDVATLEPRTSRDYRSPFQQDRDRIIYSSAFRRLQAKTQVFISGEYDFYRTRLTHSLEVAQIGRSICNYLNRHSEHLHRDFYLDADLVEAVCLAHDLGHPPFGHAGERTLNRLMRPFGGFEGNAQTVRLLAHTIYSDGSGRRGMKPTRALLDGVMKYKRLFCEAAEKNNRFLYDAQKPLRDFVLGQHPLPEAYRDAEAINRLQSIECQIMDWADDTAYSLNDIVDSVRARFLSAAAIERWAAEQQLNPTEQRLLEALMRDIQSPALERTMAKKIGHFIEACRLEKQANFLSKQTNRYAFALKVDPEIRQEARLYKRLALDLVFRSPQLHQLEAKWDFILEKVFQVYRQEYLTGAGERFRLLPGDLDRQIRALEATEERARWLCDHIAGMTDGYAIRTYKRLFHPDFGSIADLI